jgi:hypothetical protein
MIPVSVRAASKLSGGFSQPVRAGRVAAANAETKPPGLREKVNYEIQKVIVKIKKQAMINPFKPKSIKPKLNHLQ